MVNKKKSLEPIFFEDFLTYEGAMYGGIDDIMERISNYCSLKSNKVMILSYKSNYFKVSNKPIIFHNVAYIEKLELDYKNPNLMPMFPDLKEVGELYCNPKYNGYIEDFYNIDEINGFYANLNGSSYFTNNECNMWVEHLKNDLYRFTHKKNGNQWVIKINQFFPYR